MISLEHREAIRRAYHVEGKSIRDIARAFRCSRVTVRKAITSAGPAAYSMAAPRPSPMLDPFKARIDELLTQSERMPRKQRYTAKRIFDVIREEGYEGSEPTVRRYVGERRADKRRPEVFLPLEFDPGRDAQVDWGESVCIMAGKERTVQLFHMRLCFSRRPFIMAFPGQKQEAFFEGHRQAFRHFGGVPHRIAYDNLKTAVLKILKGRTRLEQSAIVQIRSHYLFESHFCTPGAGHEKGRVEDVVGFGRRNFMVPLPEVTSFDELNEHLLRCCQDEDDRTIKGQPVPIGEAWAHERPLLQLLPDYDYDCCSRHPAILNGYSQVVFETNRYSVPVEDRQRNLLVKAYPFHIEILGKDTVLASHVRSYRREQDVIDPLHYLPLLMQRPGAFEHAKPVRQWREKWPAAYEELLRRLLCTWPEGRGVREFVRILSLHKEHPADLVRQAVEEALAYSAAHYEGVMLCLRQLSMPEPFIPSLDLDASVSWASVGSQPLSLNTYDTLLAPVT
jgi:transposase